MSVLRAERARRPRWPWLLGGAAVLALLAAAQWAEAEHPVAPRAVANPGAVPVVHAQVRARAEAPAAASPVREPASALRPQAHCLQQQLDITIDGRPTRACVSATRVNQSGDVRTFALEPQGAGAWRLAVDAVQGAVIAARLDGPAGARYGCEGEACAGLSLSRRDANGARVLRSVRARLQPEAGTGAGGLPIELDAALSVTADEHDPALACSGTKLSIARDGGGLLTFCPASGVGLAMLDGGSRAYTLRNLEGENLVVVVDPRGIVEQVEFDGLSCNGAAACAGTRVVADAADVDNEARVFEFAGTSLYASTNPSVHAARAAGSARISGQLLTPAR